MLLRRLSQHVKDQNWFAVVLDLFIVILGVFIGIQVSNWNEERSENEAAESYLERLVEDFEIIEARLTSNLTRYDEALEMIDHVRAVVDSTTEPKGADADSFLVALRKITQGSIPGWRSSTFIEMQSAGDLQLIEEDRIRKALIDYDQASEIAFTAFDVISRALSHSVDPILSSVLEYRAASEAIDGRGPFYVHSFDLNKMSNESDFRTALSGLSRFKSNNRILQKRQLEMAQEVLSVLREEN